MKRYAKYCLIAIVALVAMGVFFDLLDHYWGIA